MSSLDSARLALNLDVWAYVVMPDHCHVLIYPRDPEYRIAEVLRCLKASVARAAFELHPDWRALSLVRRAPGKIEGRFWQQGGGYDRNVRSGKAAWKIIEYIHFNPVAKGLCERPSDWRCSSAGDYEGRPGRVLITKCPWWIS